MVAGGGGGLRGEINVTPLIDVLLVLLIIFMVIVPVMPHGMEAALPQPSSQEGPENVLVVQVMDAHGGPQRVRLNQEEMGMEELEGRLGAVFAVRGDRALFVKADPGVAFSTVTRVMDMARGAGAERVGLLTRADGV